MAARGPNATRARIAPPPKASAPKAYKAEGATQRDPPKEVFFGFLIMALFYSKKRPLSKTKLNFVGEGIACGGALDLLNSRRNAIALVDQTR
jgi:hypothetical protein